MKFTLRPQRRRAARSGPSISLFPFLAVLICTMGALVPLLLAMTRVARHQAESEALAKAAAEAAQHETKLRTEREDVLWRIDQLKKCRKRTESQLAGARLELGHLEDHSQRLKAQLERYENTVRDLENVENVDRRKQGESEADLQRIRDQITTTQQRVGDARREAADRNRSYAVVPYEGPNQTRRRPIYLECCADAVVLQPEGIRLTPTDFEGPMGPGNPLAAALRAARERLLKDQQFDPKAGEPYPLLLVRPEGIGAYYAAREAMKSWGCDFGYELVDDDWKLAYPQSDPRLAETVRQAIDLARQTQARLIAAAPREYARRSKPVYAASRKGGFVRVGGDSDDDDTGYRPAAAAGHVGRNAGGGSVNGYGNSEGASQGDQGIAGRSGSGGAGYARGGAGGYGSPGGGYNPYVAAAQGPGTTVAGSGSSIGPSGSATSGAGPSFGSGGNAPVVGGQPGGDVGMASGGADGVPASKGTVPSSSTRESGQSPGGVGEAPVANPYVTNPERSGNAVPGGAVGSSGTRAGAYTGTSPGNGGGSASPGNGGGCPSSGNVGGSGALPTASDRSGGTQHTGETVERPEGYIVGQPAREPTSQPSPPPKADSDSPQPGDVAERRVLRPGEWEPTPDPPPKGLLDRDKDKKDEDRFGRKKPHERPRSLAERRGEDWGLRDAARGSVGVTRPIRIECHADRFVVLSERHPAENKVVPLGPRTASSIDTLISEIWVHIESWGIAGRGMYWRPVLQVAVAPDAEERFSDLTALLDGSGLTVKRR
jgi:hypothetical protein